MRRKMNFGEVYDHFVTEAGEQSMTREAFIQECQALTDPHAMQRDLDHITFERQKARTLAAYRKHAIDKVKGE